MNWLELKTFLLQKVQNAFELIQYNCRTRLFNAHERQWQFSLNTPAFRMNTNTLTSPHHVASNNQRIIELAITQIDTNPDQPRKHFNQTSLDELTRSIESHGLLQPILVKPIAHGRYMIIAGERRFRAHQALLHTHISAIIIPDTRFDEIAIIENVQREDLRPIEYAESIANLMAIHGYNQEEAARIIGKSRSSLAELLSLLKLPEEIKSFCRTSDKISKSFMVELTRMDPDTLRASWRHLLEQGNTSVRAMRALKTPPTKPPGEAFRKANAALSSARAALRAGHQTLSAKERNILLETTRSIVNHLVSK